MDAWFWLCLAASRKQNNLGAVFGFPCFCSTFLTLHFPAGWQVLTGSLYAAVCVKDLQSGHSARQLRGL